MTNPYNPNTTRCEYEFRADIMRRNINYRRRTNEEIDDIISAVIASRDDRVASIIMARHLKKIHQQEGGWLPYQTQTHRSR